MAEPKTHQIVRTEVIETVPESGEFAVVFTFDDGTEDFGIVGDKAKAERLAKAQKGKELPVGALPMGVERHIFRRSH